MSTERIKLICVGFSLAIMPAISFAHQQGLAAITKHHGGGRIYVTDTIPAPPDNQARQPEAEKVAIVKKVPKSRRQVKPAPIPAGGAVKPIIRPKIIKPVITVGL